MVARPPHTLRRQHRRQTGRWLVLGSAGLGCAFLLAAGVTLLGLRGMSSGSARAEGPAPRAGGLTLIREIGGVARSPTPALGVAGTGQATGLRPLRRAGRVGIDEQGGRQMALAGAVPFSDDAPRAAARTEDVAPVAVLSVAEGEDRLVSFMRAAWDSEPVVRQGQPTATPTPAGQSAASSPPPTPSTGSGQAAIPTQPPAAATPTTASTTTPVPPTPAPPTPTTAPGAPAAAPTSTFVPAPTAVPTSMAAPTATTAPAGSTAAPTPTPLTRTRIVYTNVTPTPTTGPTYIYVPVPSNAQVDAGERTGTTANSAQARSGSLLPSLSGIFSAPKPTSTAAPTSTPAALVAAKPAGPSAASQAGGPAPILGERGARPPTGSYMLPGPAGGQPTQQPGGPGQPAGPAPPSPVEQLSIRALTAINAARAQAGALPLGRHPALDVAAWMHAQYDLANGQRDTNFQAPGLALYVGETPAGRVARANVGRPPALERVGEVMAQGAGDPERAVQGWLDSVFHRALVLDLQAQYAGFGQHADDKAASSVLDLAGRRDLAGGAAWYPGTTNAPTTCLCDDFAEASGRAGPFGYPVTLLLGAGRPNGQPATARLSEGGEDGPQVPADLVDAFGNPTLVPHGPLKPGTRYTARFAWQNGPDLRWGFTTAR